MSLVIIESPYSGDVETNLNYCRSCCRDSYRRGEQPFASHLLYPQFLDDNDPAERAAGISFGYNLWLLASKIIFYTDRGWSKGMMKSLERCAKLSNPRFGPEVFIRSIKADPKRPYPFPRWLELAHDKGFSLGTD